MFWEKFLELCASNNTKPTTVANALNISRGSVTNWKKGVVPQETTIFRIADYFGVPADYFKEEQQTPTTASETVPLDQSNLRMVPLYESVAAGFSAYASADVQDYMPVYFHNPSEADKTLCVKVRGDSMYPKIEDGDIIQVHKQDAVDNGEIAVVLLDGNDGLVKIVSISADAVELQSINPSYAPMRFYGKDASRIRVVGLVTQIIKGVNGRKINYISKNDGRKELVESIEQMTESELREFNRIFNEYMKQRENK